MFRDGGEPPMDHFLTVFGIDEERRTLRGHCAEPIAAEHVSG